jgi:C1A family cysteine protease
MKTKRRYGWKPDVPDHRDRIYRPRKSVQAPADLDMRTEQPPIFDQGQLGSCTGNGIAGELEAQELAQDEQLTVLSRLFIYYNERAMEHTVSEDAGASIRDGIKSVSSQGACPESDWPYLTTKFAVKPPKHCYSDARRLKAIQYSSVPQDLNSIKGALASGRGIVFGISIYDSFESDTVTKTGVVPIPEPSEGLCGGHCVRLVGYTDNGINGIPARHFIGANSWGADWGLAGYFAIPYEYVTNPSLADDLWVVTTVS